jgi:hypothetical protein
MRRCLCVTLIVLVAGGLFIHATPAFPEDEKAKPVKKPDPMALLAPFVGEWQVEGTWSSGDKLRARGVYQWGLGKKILHARTFVMNGDKEYQRYESIMAWHPEKKSLYEINVRL